MSKKEKFDWCDYYTLGKSYQNKKDAAKLRTGINRFYFSSFLKSRDHALINNLFLGKESKRIMNSKSSKIHDETRISLKNIPNLIFLKKAKK